MVLFTSLQPEVQVPQHVTTWEWLFESKESSPLYSNCDGPLGAYIDSETKERLDWAQVKSASTVLSGCLIRQYGLQPGETVSLFSTNNIWYPVCMFAVIRAGAIINGASPAYTVDEMAYALTVAKTKILITLPASLDKALAAAKQVGIPMANVILIRGIADGFKSVQDLIQQQGDIPSPPPHRIPTGSTNKDMCGYLNFSSGTTGLPKAVMISHHNVIAQCYQSRQIQVDPDRFKVLAIMPLFHITGTWRFCHYPIFLNGDAVMLPTFTMPAMLKAMTDFHIEELVLVPPLLLRLARDAVVEKFDLRHVRRWTSGAAPISQEVLKDLEQRFPWTSFRQGYGATEAACVAAQPPTRNEWKYGASAGMLLPNTVAKVIDTKGRELGPNQPGELLFKGPQVALGYLDNSTATTETFDQEGFYHTGDAGYVDDEGMIYVTDRIKEMIKVKGSQVPPAELEDLLLGHETVEDCAVLSIPDEYAGELPKAYVVLKSDIEATESIGQQLLDYVRKNKVRYKWLVEIEFIDKIPKSAAGKILRRVLKERERERDAKREVVTVGLRVRDRERSRPGN